MIRPLPSYSLGKERPLPRCPIRYLGGAKKERIHRLIDLQNRISLKRNQELVGHELEVLVEGTSKNDTQLLTGKTRTAKTVLFPGTEDLVGQLVNVGIREAQTWSLTGEII